MPFSRTPFAALLLGLIGWLLYASALALPVLSYFGLIPLPLSTSGMAAGGALVAGALLQAIGSVAKSLHRIARHVEGPSGSRSIAAPSYLDETSVSFSEAPPGSDHEVFERLYKGRE